MPPWDHVPIFDSRGAAYHEAFQTFLDHTDQKDKARAWLDGLVGSLPQRELFIDAGAGNGEVTAWYCDQFARCIAIEPNPFLRTELAACCPAADVLADNILDARPSGGADFVLVSHVFYYIPQCTWREHLETLASWLSETGVAVVVLQNGQSDCMRMVNHFLGRSFSLKDAARGFAADHADLTVEVETLPARIATSDLDVACTISAFMLNLLHDELGPIQDRLTRAAVENYLRQNSRDGAGGYRLSCDQDFLTIRSA